MVICTSCIFFSEYFGENHPELGLILATMGKLYFILEQYEDAHKYLRQGRKCIKISHGQEHSLYRDLRVLVLQCQGEMDFYGRYIHKIH